MKRVLLVVADGDDPLAQALLDRAPSAVLVQGPARAPFAFGFDQSGRLEQGHFELGGQAHEWQQVDGIVFRPGPAWSLPRRTRSAARLFAAHEWRTAWCALLRAFPRPVVDRLPPGWFLQRQGHGAVQTGSLAAGLGAASALGPRPDGSVVIVGRRLLSIDRSAGSRQFRAWLRRRHAQLWAWQCASGVQCARIDGCLQGRTWALCGVDRVPPSSGIESEFVDRWAVSLLDLLAT